MSNQKQISWHLVSKQISSVFLFAIIFLTPTNVFAADCWIVSGAGTSAVNGDYYLAGDSSDYDNAGTTGLAGTDAWTLDSLVNGYVLAVTDDGAGTYNATELRGITLGLFNGTGYYYGIISAPYDNYAGINTLNSGSAPVPTITFSDCGSSVSTSSSATSTVEGTNQNLFNGFILFYVSLIFIIWFFRK